MKSFGIAFTLWSGTILLCCSFFCVVGIFTMEGWAIGAAITGFFVAPFVCSPLLLFTTLLTKLAGSLPYSEAARLYWLGFMLIVQNYLFFALLCFVETIVFDGCFFDGLFPMSVAGLIVMLCFKRNSINNFFSQRTTNSKS